VAGITVLDADFKVVQEAATIFGDFAQPSRSGWPAARSGSPRPGSTTRALMRDNVTVGTAHLIRGDIVGMPVLTIRQLHPAARILSKAGKTGTHGNPASAVSQATWPRSRGIEANLIATCTITLIAGPVARDSADREFEIKEHGVRPIADHLLYLEQSAIAGSFRLEAVVTSGY
jgi:hypothetical protein